MRCAVQHWMQFCSGPVCATPWSGSSNLAAHTLESVCRPFACSRQSVASFRSTLASSSHCRRHRAGGPSRKATVQRHSRPWSPKGSFSGLAMSICGRTPLLRTSAFACRQAFHSSTETELASRVQPAAASALTLEAYDLTAPKARPLTDSVTDFQYWSAQNRTRQDTLPPPLF